MVIAATLRSLQATEHVLTPTPLTHSRARRQQALSSRPWTMLPSVPMVCSIRCARVAALPLLPCSNHLHLMSACHTTPLHNRSGMPGLHIASLGLQQRTAHECMPHNTTARPVLLHANGDILLGVHASPLAVPLTLSVTCIRPVAVMLNHGMLPRSNIQGERSVSVLLHTYSTLSALGSKLQGYNVAAPVISDAVKTATPILEQAWKTTSGAAGPALRGLLPTVEVMRHTCA